MKFKVVKRCKEDLSSIHGLLKSFLPYTQKKIGFNRPPTIYFQSDQVNANKLLGKTAYYDPSTMSIVLYVTGRHPKDVLRSLSHELVHHGQNCRGEFSNVQDTTPGYAQNNNHLRNMELQAYKDGNIFFRDWEDAVKAGKIHISMPLRETLEKNDNLLVERWNLIRATGRFSLNTIQNLLMVVGFLDFLGPIAMGADFANGVLYLLRGRYLDAIISFIFVFPGSWVGLLPVVGAGRVIRYFNEAKKSKMIKQALLKIGKSPDDVVKGGQRLFDDAIRQIDRLADSTIPPEQKKQVIQLLNDSRSLWTKKIPSILESLVGTTVIGGAAVASTGTAVAIWSANSGYKDPEEEGSTLGGIPRDNETGELYTVKKGDNLSYISRNEYGSAIMWPLIYKANAESIGPNPNYLKTKLTLVIPPASSWELMGSEEVIKIRKMASYHGDGKKRGSTRIPDTDIEKPQDKGILKNIFSILGIFQKDYVFPIKEGSVYRITSPYGVRGRIGQLSSDERYAKKHMHHGIDIGCVIGTEVVAPQDGVILRTNWGPRSGMAMTLKDSDGLIHKFFHLSAYRARKRDTVKKGEVIALSGASGRNVTGPHLHYEVKDVKDGQYNKKGGYFDPLELFKNRSIPIKEWKNEELNKLLLEKFNLGVKK